ncbi:DUF2255 family protein [Telluria mixta]|uniref:DUF2255 family protein n=1 Tax=Telluria mixta TaxID=34071 RepID=A0ABT2C4D5_9BURK|nr:DUF2255 family protein [Telluria mixta]MCS0632234.1 DUF2255 family protein [Telluria mixta]WEM95007.1 DUF2255 family protein [Telluria mixta]
MTTRLTDELRRMAESDDLHIAPLREDGVTHGTPRMFNDRIDEAYRAKYQGNSCLGSMIGPRARSATIKVIPSGRAGND